jgi:hypothetical protein
MSRVFFEEKQVLPRYIVWITVFTTLAMCIPLLRGLYIRQVLNGPWGKSDFSVGEIYLSLALVLLVGSLVVWLIASMSLVVKIEGEAISYRSFPAAPKEKRISRHEILNYQVRKLHWKELIQSTKSRRLLQHPKRRIYRFSGRMGLVLNLVDDASIILGTTNPDGMIWAMKKLMGPS